MEIKPTGAGGPQFDPAARIDETGKKPFTGAVSEPATPGTVSAGGVGEFAKADLQDPAKQDAIVNHYLGEFLDTASQRIDIPVSAAGKSQVMEYLASDPLVRGKLLNYLEQVLK